MQTESFQSQTFEFADDYFEKSSERGVAGFAKIACVLLAGVSLTFSVLDILEVRSLREASGFWDQKLRPAFASLVADADFGSRANAAAASGSDAVIVKAPFDSAPRSQRVTAPYVLPENARPMAVAAAPAPPPANAAPLRSEYVRPQAGPRLAAFASASSDDRLKAPPLAADPLLKPQADSVAAPPEQPEPRAVALTVPFPSLDLVPLPRAAPNRESETHDPTPAELLGLDINPKERAKAERCLANAIYFESRSEPLRGQMAVAQVVMNRVFSPFYPKDVCAVVYQNANRHLSCQFTFACDGKSKAIHDRGSWARVNRIAKQTLDGKLWVPEVAKSTHYHAQYVRPNWIHEMRRMFKTGVHLFYRPYNWGDGSDEQGWVKPVQTATAKKN